MAGKALISLSTGLEDPEKVTVAFLVAVGAAGSGRPPLMLRALPDLLARYDKARGRYMAGPVCFDAKQLYKY